MSDIVINPGELQEIGDNIKMIRKDNLLILVIDENSPINTVSSTGKTMAIANSKGMSRVDGKLLNFWYGRKL